MSQRKKLLWTLLLGFIVVWPIAVTIYVTPALNHLRTSRARASLAELQMVMRVRRFTLEIPQSKDGWILRLSSFIDGEQRGGGGATVEGGSSVVLLLERSDEPHLDYCWYVGSEVMHGSLPNPFVNAGMTTERTQGTVKPGDWLIRGGRHQVSGDGRADFELRVTLSPPHDEGQSNEMHSSGGDPAFRSRRSIPAAP